MSGRSRPPDQGRLTRRRGRDQRIGAGEGVGSAVGVAVQHEDDRRRDHKDECGSGGDQRLHGS
jgi:hypothetical protein